MTDSQPQPDSGAVPEEVLRALQGLDSCSVANAIEATGVRLRDEGYGDATIGCRFPELGPLVGYAFTLSVSTTHPKVQGVRYVDHIDWAPQLFAVPQPRVLVIEDLSSGPRTGAFLGEVHASIYRALGCIGVVTTGAIRDVPALRRVGFQAFSRYVSVSHAYVHVVSAGVPVSVGGMTVESGALLHADQHGVVCVPKGVADQLPDIAARQKDNERRIIEYCRSSGFSLQGIAELLQQVQSEHPLPE
jgi:4-hydroxy-4-methyl-2-oxoglutarate aldolase